MKSVTEKIPTYQIGAPEINPIFFTGRVYQGAEGYIYPYPLYDVLTEKKVEQDYNVLRLDNQYVNIAILPEIGGRIFAASDKTNDYPFFYTQTGVKPALIGMLGAWLSGGVEWNIPDHHRASSYMPINWTMKENEDGSKTIWIGETELRHRLKWSIGGICISQPFLGGSKDQSDQSNSNDSINVVLGKCVCPLQRSISSDISS